jgi:predicted molibdopterin-dependent oxidoreductase YjgC
VDDGFLIRGDKTANREGANLLLFDVDRGGESTRALVADVAAGKVTTLILIGDETAALPEAEPGQAAQRKPDLFVASIGPFATGHAAAAHLRIPAAAYGEFEGTWVNFHGRAQRVRRAVTPRAASLPCWQVLSLLLQKLGAKAPYQLSAEILRELAAAVPAFAGLSWTSLGATGVQAPGAGGGDDPAPKGLPKSQAVPVPHG